MLVSRKLDQLETAAAEIVASGATGRGGGVRRERRRRRQLRRRASAATIERFGGLDILVNNAATNPYYGPTLGGRRGPLRQDLPGQPARSAVLVPGRVGAGAMKDKPGVIVNIASVGGLRAEGAPRRLQPHQGGADPPHPAARLRARSHPRRRRGARSGADRLRRVPGRQLRRPPGRADAAEAARRTAGHRQPGDVPGLGPASWITGETYVIDGGAGVRSGAME